jgi:hypothetical protein
MEVQAQHEGEKAALVETIKRLNSEVVRLESFKRSLMQTLTEDEVRRVARLASVRHGLCAHHACMLLLPSTVTCM